MPIIEGTYRQTVSMVNVRDYNTISDAISALGSGDLYFPKGTHQQTTNLTVASGIRLVFEQGAMISIDGIAISAITNANPGKVTTSSAHNFSNGNKVRFKDIGGMVEVNYSIKGGVEYTVTVVDSTNFTIGVNTSTYTPYTSGGYAQHILTINGAPDAGFYQIFTGNGAVAWNTNQPIYPEYFGVDGVSDNVEINTAIISLPSSGGEVRLIGSYIISSTINMNRLYVSLAGANGDAFRYPAAKITANLTSGFAISITNHYNTIKNLFIQGNSTADGGIAIGDGSFAGPGSCEIDDCQINLFSKSAAFAIKSYGYDLLINNVKINNITNGTGIYQTHSTTDGTTIVIRKCYIRICDTCLVIGNEIPATNRMVSNVHIEDTLFESSKVGLYIRMMYGGGIVYCTESYFENLSYPSQTSSIWTEEVLGGVIDAPIVNHRGQLVLQNCLFTYIYSGVPAADRHWIKINDTIPVASQPYCKGISTKIEACFSITFYKNFIREAGTQANSILIMRDNKNIPVDIHRLANSGNGFYVDRNASRFGKFEIMEGKLIAHRTASPTSAAWKKGDIVFNTAPAAGGVPGWVCVRNATTTMRVAGTSPNTILEVNDTTGMVAGDIIGCQLDISNEEVYQHWTTIVTVVDIDTVEIATPLPSAVSIGQEVWTYCFKAMAALAA